jgi:hypothetical protein
MDWNIVDNYKGANHNPVVGLNGNIGKAIAKAQVKAGEKVQLSAKGSSDPDGDQLNYRWFIYPEAGGFTGKLDLSNPASEDISFAMPELKNGQQLHVILEVKDSGTPSLFGFRRVVLTHP